MNELQTLGQCVDAITHEPSPLKRLEQRRERLRQELNDVNVAIASLQENPEVERVLMLLAKVSHY